MPDDETEAEPEKATKYELVITASGTVGRGTAPAEEETKRPLESRLSMLPTPG